MDGITDSTDMSFSKLQEMVKGKPGMLQSSGCKVSDTTEQLNNNEMSIANRGKGRELGKRSLGEKNNVCSGPKA